MGLVSRLREVRESAGLTQDQLGRQLGWADHTHVANVEAGKKGTSIEQFERWFSLCGYDLYIVPQRDIPAGDSVAALLAYVGPEGRSLLIQLARLLPRMSKEARLRLESDIKFLEGLFPPSGESSDRP